MYKNKKNIALIVAAGSGTRAQTSIPKQYVQVKKKALLAHTLKNLSNIESIDHIMCVIAPEHQKFYQTHIQDHPKLLPVVYGGKTRQESVYAGLLALADYNPQYVFIHDAARPHINQKIVTELLNKLSTHEGVCPALKVTDSLQKIDGTIINREDLYSIQTPQAFDYHKILAAHQNIHHMPHNFTDDMSIATYNKLKTCFCDGTHNNYKITYPDDFKRFEQENTMLINPDIRTASGYDVHRLIEGNGIILGGITLPCRYKLKGHSDADVLLHAITDALLGTIAAKDIGYHFSPHDSRWKNADSAEFLKYAHQLVIQKKGTINFLDATIICETPKIAPYQEKIQKNIAHLLNLPTERVSIKATTTEKLGFTGRKEGIAAQATATVFITAT